MVGVHYCPNSKDLFIVYYKKRDDCLGVHGDVSAAMAAHSNPHAFSKSFFKDKLQCTNVDDMHIRYLNQISGTFFKQWKHKQLSYAEKNGQFYHQISLKPDQWVTGPLCPEQEKKVKIMKATNSKNIKGLSTTRCISQVDRKCGLSKLHQFSGGETLIMYTTRRTRLNAGKANLVWIPMFPSPPGRQVFAVIHKEQKDRYDNALMQLGEPAIVTNSLLSH